LRRDLRESPAMPGPLLTAETHAALRAAAGDGAMALECSLDLGRTRTTVEVHAGGWRWQGHNYPWIDDRRERPVYHWTGTAWEAVQRFSGSLIKLVPTEWGAPTFEIDGIKMLPTAQVSPYADAERKVGLIAPRGKTILDCCGGLGYFAACCLAAGARQIMSFEKNPDVIWLRSLSPWSPQSDPRLTLTQGDIAEAIKT